MYEFINITEKQYTEYLKCSNPAEDSIELQNQVSQKQNEDLDLSDDWDGDWNEPYVKNDIDDSPPTIEESLSAYLNLCAVEKEGNFIHEFYKEIVDISEKNCQSQKMYDRFGSRVKESLKRVDHLIDKCLKSRIKLNLSYSIYKNTVSNSIFEELINIVHRVVKITPTTRARIDPDTGEEYVNELTETDNFEFLVSIINKLLLAGAQIDSGLYNDSRIDEVMHGNEEFTKLEEIKSMLKNVAYKSITNSDKRFEDLKVEVDNTNLFIKVPKNSSIKVAKITDSKISRDLDIKESVLKIGDNIVRVEKVGRKRNYVDVVGNSIMISIPTELGNIKIRLYPDYSNTMGKIKVELDKESQNKIDKLQGKSTIGEGFFLGGKSVLDAIKDGSFERNGSVSVKLAEAIEQSNNAEIKTKTPFSLMKKVCNVQKLFCGSSVDKT